MKAITRAQARRIDRVAEDSFGLSGRVLMENAGLLAALELRAELGDGDGPVSVVCGSGGNGGDGLVVARQLALRKVQVQLWLASPAERLSVDALANLVPLQAAGLEPTPLLDDSAVQAACQAWGRSALLVDALLGTGFRGELRAPLAAIIEGINTHCSTGAVPVVALDLPSGLDADTGKACPIAVRARRTLTFVAPKVGFERESAAEFTGRVSVLPIGAPAAVLERVLAD